MDDCKIAQSNMQTFSKTRVSSGDSTQLLYLRARHYAPGLGRFLSRDTWGGDTSSPLSLNRWNYTEGNPVNYTDPSGHFPSHCQSMPTKWLYELCVLNYYKLEPISYFELGTRVRGDRGCYLGPSEYRAPGYLEGLAFWALIHRFGSEVVYDFASMERVNFTYWAAGVNDAVDLGGGAQVYVGWASGFRTDDNLSSQYRGVSSSAQVGLSGDLGIGVGFGGGGFVSWSDPMLRGAIIYVGGSGSLDLLPIVDFDVAPMAFYFADNNSRKPYVMSNGKVNKMALLTDILIGDRSPLTIQTTIDDATIYVSENHVTLARASVAAMAMNYAIAYEELRNGNTLP